VGDIDYGKRVIDRRKANEKSRTKAVESREDRLEKLLLICMDRWIITLMLMFDGHQLAQCQTFNEMLKYLEDHANDCLKMEQTPQIGLEKRLAHFRRQKLYGTMRSSVRYLLRLQYQEDKFQP
jgi:hypothetical protein